MKILDIISDSILKVGVYKPRTLLKTNAVEQLDRIKSQAFADEIEKIFRENLRKIGFAAVYKDLSQFETFKSINSLAGKRNYGKTIIVDEFSFYVPYHIDAVNFGIYFRIERIKRDFRNFANYTYYALRNGYLSFLKDEYPSRWIRLRGLINQPEAFIVSLFISYIAFHYFHALNHHIIEDISTYLECIKKGKYSPLRSIEEEKFAIWAAFRALESYKVPEVLYQSKKAERLFNLFSHILPAVEPEKIVDVTFAMPTLLYVFYNYHRENIFVPEVTRKASYILSIIWPVMKHLHYTFEIEPIRIMGEHEIFSRLFITQF